MARTKQTARKKSSSLARRGGRYYAPAKRSSRAVKTTIGPRGKKSSGGFGRIGRIVGRKKSSGGRAIVNARKKSSGARTKQTARKKSSASRKSTGGKAPR